jgi:hypothetical protein
MNQSCDPNCETQKWTMNSEICVGLFAIWIYSPVKNYASIIMMTVLETRINNAHVVPPSAVASFVYNPNRNLGKRGNQMAGKQSQRRRRGRDRRRRFAMMKIVSLAGKGVSCCCAIDMVVEHQRSLSIRRVLRNFLHQEGRRSK